MLSHVYIILSSPQLKKKMFFFTKLKQVLILFIFYGVTPKVVSLTSMGLFEKLFKFNKRQDLGLSKWSQTAHMGSKH